MLQVIENGYSAARSYCIIVLGTKFQQFQIYSQTKCARREDGESRALITQQRGGW